ncbi:MAG: DUF4350 domain-containing protein [Blastococcus sp.]
MTAPAATTTDPTAAQLWRAARGPLAVAGAVLLGALALAAVAGGRPSGYLDPRAADPAGSRALAQVLRHQGVRVDLVRTLGQVRATVGPSDTLFVAAPDLLVDSQVRAVRGTGADLVLAAPALPGRYVAGLTRSGTSRTGTLAPGCALAAAQRAGTAAAGGTTYNVDLDATDPAGRPTVASADLCYSRDARPSLVQLRTTEGPTVTVLGNPAPLTNDRLDDEGDAALALGLLGQNPRLVWYLPTPGDVPSSEQRSLYQLAPHGVWWGLAQLAVAVLLLALWRARRLGAVVPEPLPVVVRATETLEGRGRMYRRSGARSQAAGALRSASLARLRPALGLGRRSEPQTVADAVAARSRRASVEVAALLYGAAPGDDAALVRLADDLDALEREVRRP